MKITNWKTTGTGILGIVGIIWKIVTTKTMGPEDITGIMTSVGLILAKDSNVTGGTVQQ